MISACETYRAWLSSASGRRCFFVGLVVDLGFWSFDAVGLIWAGPIEGPQVPPLIDYYGFTMASINENGCVFAIPCKGEENMSVLMYQPFIGLATDSAWTMEFKGEEVKVVANGSGWVAAVTSLNLLHIFSEGGLQRHIFSLNGPVVTALECEDQLAVVMKFRVFNISRMTQKLKGRVALTPGSSLTWMGFSEEGALSSYDSEGVLRVFLTSQFGGSWIPVFMFVAVSLSTISNKIVFVYQIHSSLFAVEQRTKQNKTTGWFG